MVSVEGDTHKVGIIDVSRNNTRHAAHEVVQANKEALKKVFHKDHEHLHRIILLCLLIFVVVAQVGLHYWRKNHKKSFIRVSLAGLWLVPFVMSLCFRFYRMIVVWSVFSVACARIIWLARARPMQRTTPKKVYHFFLATHQISYTLAVAGYVLLVIEFMGVGAMLPWTAVVTYYAILFIFYGLYFGVLARDIAELCTDRMAATLGLAVRRKRGDGDGRGGGDDDDDDDVALPSASMSGAAMCALCREPLQRSAFAHQYTRGVPNRFVDDEDRAPDGAGGGADGALGGGGAEDEKIFTLNCKHQWRSMAPLTSISAAMRRCLPQFHESCIRGWAITGKKDCCCICMEKVQLSDLVESHPWQKTSLIWSQALDSLRYMLVWNPIMLTAAQLFVYFSDR